MQFIVSGQRIAVENFVTGKLYNILFKNDTQVNITCTSIGADCVVFQGEAPLNLFTLTMQNADTIDTIEPTQLGTTNYNNLINKPSINGVDLIGNKTNTQLGIRDVPAIIEADDGKVLTAASDGSYSWQELPEGTTDYTDLSNKPQINDVTLTGNVSLSDLGAAAASDIPTTPGDIGAEPAITSENKLDPALIAYDSSHAAITSAQVSQIGTNETNISTVNTALNPTDYTTVDVYTGRDITIAFGGYVKIGKLVIVTVRCAVNTAIAANNAIFSGLPIPMGVSSLSAGAFAISLSNNQKLNIGITVEGNISTTENISTGNLVITGCYISAT